MEYGEKLNIWRWVLVITILLNISSAIWVSKYDSFGIGFFVIGFLASITFIPALIFTIYYLLKSKGKEFNDGKIATVGGILFFISLLFYLINNFIYIAPVSAQEAANRPATAVVLMKLASLQEVLGVTSLFLMFPFGLLTVIFFIKYLVGKRNQ